MDDGAEHENLPAAMRKGWQFEDEELEKGKTNLGVLVSNLKNSKLEKKCL
jgi:hypothetical protein